MIVGESWMARIPRRLPLLPDLPRFLRETAGIQHPLGRHPPELVLPPGWPGRSLTFPTDAGSEEKPDIPGSLRRPEDGLERRPDAIAAIPVVQRPAVGHPLRRLGDVGLVSSHLARPDDIHGHIGAAVRFQPRLLQFG